MKYKKILFSAAMLLTLTGCKPDIPYIETTTSEEEFSTKFYYNLLETEEEKLAYREVYEGLFARQDEFYIHGKSEEILDTVLDGIMYDYPEIFWYDAKTEVSYELWEEHKEEYTIVRPAYAYSGEEVQKMKEDIQEETEKCIEECKELDSEYGKVRYVYEYLIDSVDYVDGASNNQNIYSALVSEESVCAGYAKSVQYLLEKVGIECITVTGEATDNEGDTESHAWNVVNCDGDYYYVDATWGDPEGQKEDISRLMVYDYLCCSEAELSKTHKADKEGQIPECTSEELNYYRRNGMFYESVDDNEILAKMKESIAEKEEYTIFKFSTKEDYEEALGKMEDTLLNEALDYLARYYGLRQSNCNYEYDEMLYRINIYWSYK